jgi:hypothetical protein
MVSLVAGLVLGVVGCGPVHYGTYPDGLGGFPERAVSAEMAVEAARPYLDQSFALCRAARGSDWPDYEPRIRVQLEGKYYKVLKDNYPSMNASYGFNHAVKVNADTGEVTPPQ